MPRWVDPRAARRGDAGEAGYGAPRFPRLDDEDALTHDGEPFAYGGQEYGVEGRSSAAGAPPAPGWGVERDDEERRRNFDFEDPGMGQSQAGYAFDARSSHEPGFDADYVRWRDAQLRAHDLDYEAWRRELRRRYDEDYLRERTARDARDRNGPR